MAFNFRINKHTYVIAAEDVPARFSVELVADGGSKGAPEARRRAVSTLIDEAGPIQSMALLRCVTVGVGLPSCFTGSSYL